MKISEITDRNDAWRSLRDINFDELFSSYQDIIESWPIIKNDRSISRKNTHKGNIQLFLDNLIQVISIIETFPDSEDSDLIRIKNDLMIAVTHLDEILK